MTGGRNDGILLEKTKKAGCIRLTSGKGKEVNSEYGGGPEGAQALLCGCSFASVFLFSEGGASVISNVVHQLNEEIRDKEIRLIGETGEQLGIMSSADALHIADERGLDLVKISPNAVPPVCKLMDYGKYRFEQTKREKEARKNQRVVEIKEIRMSPSIDVNDFNVKLRNAQKFLADGNRCKITVRFRGREMAHTNIGQDLLLKFAESCGETAVMDKSPKLEGRHMSIFLSPKPAKDTKK